MILTEIFLNNYSLLDLPEIQHAPKIKKKAISHSVRQKKRLVVLHLFVFSCMRICFHGQVGSHCS